MSDHVRKQIRDAVVNALTDATTAAGNLYSDTAHAVDKLPCLIVTTPEDERNEDASSMSSDGFDLLIAVDVCAAKSTGLDDMIDTLCKEVHVALVGDSTLAALVMNLTLEGTGPIEIDDEARIKHGRARMRWLGLYSINPSDPTTPL